MKFLVGIVNLDIIFNTQNTITVYIYLKCGYSIFLLWDTRLGPRAWKSNSLLSYTDRYEVGSSSYIYVLSNQISID
jgi:hypothetical protein